METIRNIVPADLHRVNALLARAFTQERADEGYRFTQVPECRIEFLEMYLDAFPSGSYLLEVDGKIRAFGFAHLWGEIGWIGPVAVTPEIQGRGHGREIVNLCIDALKDAGVRTIGLETMPRSYRNLGFYGKIGFVPCGLTMDLAGEVFTYASSPAQEPRANVQWYGRLSEAGKEAFLKEAAELADSVCQGLDYCSLIVRTAKYDYGDSAILENEDGRALAIGHVEPYASDEERHVLRVVAFAVPFPVRKAFLDAAIATLQDWARREYLGHINFRVPTENSAAFRYLLHRDYRIVHSDLRMTLEGYPLMMTPGSWLLDKWE